MSALLHIHGWVVEVPVELQMHNQRPLSHVITISTVLQLYIEKRDFRSGKGEQQQSGGYRYPRESATPDPLLLAAHFLHPAGPEMAM